MKEERREDVEEVLKRSTRSSFKSLFIDSLFSLKETTAFFLLLPFLPF